MASSVIKNGSFENGLKGWSLHDLSSPYRAATVAGAGVFDNAFSSFTTLPTDGNAVFLTGYDGGGPGTISLVQRIEAPVGVDFSLLFEFRAGWDMIPYGATLPRSFHVDIQSGPDSNAPVLSSTTFLTSNPGTSVNDTGVLLGKIDFTSVQKHFVYLSFEWDIPENYVGPALFQLDNIVLADPNSIGTSGNDLLVGSNKPDSLYALDGDDTIQGLGDNDFLKGGEGADLLIGGIGSDSYDLKESVAVTDTVQIDKGDSTAQLLDFVTNFALGNGTSSTDVDQLDLAGTAIAADAAQVDGINANNIRSHSIANGLITFDDVNVFTTALVVGGKHDLGSIIRYLDANIHGGDTVAFIYGNDTYVFQDGNGEANTLVQLIGAQATSLGSDGMAADSVWIV